MIAGSADLIVATEDVSLGMGGPAMIEGGGLGRVDPDDVGPADVQAANGVVDVLAADEPEAVAVAKRLLSYFQGATDPGAEPDQAKLRDLVPERRRRAYDVRPVIETLADEGSVTFLRERFAPGMVTALARIEGRPLGIVANNPMHLAGAITSDGVRQGGALHAALRRLRAAAGLADRHAGDDGRPGRRGDRRSCATARGCSSPAPRCGSRSSP